MLIESRRLAAAVVAAPRGGAREIAASWIVDLYPRWNDRQAACVCDRLKEMNVTSVNTPMTREDVLKTFAPLLQSFGQGPAQGATRAEAAEQAKARDIVERAASYTVESIIKSLADLQVNLGGAIDSLADRLEQEASKLGELRHALSSEGRRLHELRNTRVAAEALEILIQDHKRLRCGLSPSMLLGRVYPF
jgi:hypothetical protein